MARMTHRHTSGLADTHPIPNCLHWLYQAQKIITAHSFIHYIFTDLPVGNSILGNNILGHLLRESGEE